MSKNPSCDYVSFSKVASFIRRTPFILGLLSLIVLFFPSIYVDTAKTKDQDISSFIYLNGLTKKETQNCEKKKTLTPVCAGAIISKRYILTAASCLDNSKLQLHAGMSRSYTTQVLKIKNGYRHSGYTTKENLIRNDIAVLKPIRSIEFSKYVAKAKLAKSTHYFRIGALCKAMIMTKDDKDKLQVTRTNVTIVEGSNCNIDGPSEICLEQKTDDGLELNGTSLWCPRGRSKKKYVMAGLLSRVRMKYTIYTNVSYYKDWIHMIRHFII